MGENENENFEISQKFSLVIRCKFIERELDTGGPMYDPLYF